MLDVAIEVERRDLTIEAAFSVQDGERLALFGPSGSGKTSILEVIAGLTQPSRGQVSLGDRKLSRIDRGVDIRVPPWIRQVGLLRQDPGLFPHLTVRQNITYSKAAASSPESALMHMVERLEIAQLLKYLPRALSGGQAHRVALARLLLAGHDALLLDEPYTGLDARLQRVLTDVVREESQSRAVPSILVAHELGAAQAFADRLAVLDSGRIVQVGAPADVVRRPATRRVAELVGYLGFVPVSVLIGDNSKGRPVSQGRHLAPDGVMAVHPERTQLGASPDRGVVLTGPVVGVRPSGTGWEIDLDVGSRAAPTPLTCRVADDPPVVGCPFAVTVLDPPWFAADGRLLPVSPRVSS